jgi:hypothetical protein
MQTIIYIYFILALGFTGYLTLSLTLRSVINTAARYRDDVAISR